jgi:MarR family transcriptional regulator for hemolysin
MTEAIFVHGGATADLLHAALIWRRKAERALINAGISAVRANVLVLLKRLGEGSRQVQLAEAIGLSSNSLVRLLDELATSGLIRREPDPTDRRANCLWLTEEGEELIIVIETILAQLREKTFRNLSPADLEGTRRFHQAIIYDQS